uniref:Uncharacterized protein n=1 Tax=Arundo donax TaxID=35708 RepID=A0A0A9DVI5_ARUDO
MYASFFFIAVDIVVASLVSIHVISSQSVYINPLYGVSTFLECTLIA